MKRRLAELPLHTGRAPGWLFKRMARLAGAITMAVVDAYGPDEMLRRLADPWWFQAFGCVLGFDWHSSGLTTVTCGAMKEAQRLVGDDLGILVAGGKGSTSRRTPREIEQAADRLAITGGAQLVFASRMSAKVDSAAVQDGYQIYQHNIMFTPSGAWCVVQQGMNKTTGWARRYHWLGESVDDFVCEPHQAIHDSSTPLQHRASDTMLLNMVAREAQENREASAALVREQPDRIMDKLSRVTEGPTLFAPQRHGVLSVDVNRYRLRQILDRAHEQYPRDFQALVGISGVGPATVRSLSLLAELIYDAPASHRDLVAPLGATKRDQGRKWADYTYAHGGKDGTPFPVDCRTYDRNIAILTEAVCRARLGQWEKTKALRRLSGRMRSASVAQLGTPQATG